MNYEWSKERVCKRCRGHFVAKAKHQDYCTPQCKFVEDKCATCGVLVYRLWRHWVKRKKIYCSIGCKALGQKRRVPIQCFLCGDKVYRKKSRIIGKKAFCSHFCLYVFRAYIMSSERMIYDPISLRDLNVYNMFLTECNFLDCTREKAPRGRTNLFGCCRIHAKRIYQALWQRTKTRKQYEKVDLEVEVLIANQKEA